MAESTDNLVLEHLRHIRAKVDRVDERLDRIEGRVGSIEQILSAMHTAQVVHQQNLDQLNRRVDRVEKRLELVD